MALHNCPACEREFKKLEDFPLIFVRSFERVEIPSNVVFPFQDPAIFVETGDKCFNDKPPEEVLHYFEKNPDEEEFEYKGWEWTKEGSGDTGFYNRNQKDQRDIILKQINPYLSHLESLIGQEVLRAELLPKFQRNNYFQYAFDISETGYHLMIGNNLENELAQAHIIILGEGLNLGSAGGPTLTDKAVVGILEYEGRVKK